MTTEYAGITIVIDLGPKRTIVNIPRAVNVDVEVIQDFVATEQLLPFSARPRRSEMPLIRHTWQPVGDYTIREEDNPMHIAPTPELSKQERAEVDQFGIHDEARNAG